MWVQTQEKMLNQELSALMRVIAHYCIYSKSACIRGELMSNFPSYHLIGFAQEAPARLLCDYLNSQKIVAHLVILEDRSKQASHPYVVAINDERHMSDAKTICQTFLHNPNDKRFQSAAWELGQIVPTTGSIFPSSQTVISQIRAAPISFAIVLLCVVVYAVFSINRIMVFDALHFQPFEQLIQTGQWWRLWSPAVIHLSVLHIVFNLLWWWSLGKNFERIFGRIFIASFFLVTALLSNYGQFLVSGSGFGGLSGVVYAMFGCTWWLGWLRPEWGLNLSKPVIGFMLIWLVLGHLDVLFVGMANTAHTVGLLSGLVIALLLTKVKKPTKKQL